MTVPEIFTVGYEGSDLADFIALLRSLRSEVLCDVRDVPSSRKPGFSKNPLAAALAGSGIEYRHFRALGDPKEGRLAARAGKFDSFRQIFSSHLQTHAAQSDLEDLNKVVLTSRVCLMCFEREPKECHRSIVADVLHDRHGYNIRHVRVPKGFSGQGVAGPSAENVPDNGDPEGRDRSVKPTAN